MWSPSTHKRRDVFLLLMVVMVTSLMEVVAAPSYSPCIRPMDAKCADTRSKLSDKIIGGHIGEPGSTPWLVSLQDTNYPHPAPFCCGTLLSHSWVLTSASCVYSYQQNYASIEVVVGEYDMDEVDGYERYRFVSQITLHPDFDYFTNHADVALIRLGFYVFYNERIGVLKLPTKYHRTPPAGLQDDPVKKRGEDIEGEKNTKNDMYTIAGWGRVGENGEPSPVVRVAQIPLVNREVCQAAYPEFTDTMICAGNVTHGGLDPCQGDMGGPLASSDGFIIGVSSWGVGCGRPGYPSVYTDVSKVIDWICEVTNKWTLTPSDRLATCREGWTDSLAQDPLSSWAV